MAVLISTVTQIPMLEGCMPPPPPPPPPQPLLVIRLYQYNSLLAANKPMSSEPGPTSPSLPHRYLVQNLDWLEEQLGDFDDDYVLFDCPGKGCWGGGGVLSATPALVLCLDHTPSLVSSGHETTRPFLSSSTAGAYEKNRAPDDTHSNTYHLPETDNLPGFGCDQNMHMI